MHNSSSKILFSVIVLIYSAFILVGCSSESDNVINCDPSLGGDVASLSFSNVTASDFNGNPVTRADGSIEQERIGYNLGEEQGVQLVSQQGSAELSSPHTRAVTNLPNGIRYRVVVYKDAEYAAKTIYKQREYQVGSSEPVSGTNITLPAGSYKIFAYSFNTKTDLPELTGSAISVKDGDDFMSTDMLNQTVTESQMGTNINMTLNFRRRCCNIWVKVESIAYTNTAISNCTVSLNNLPAQATWNVGGTSFTQTGNTTETKAYFVNVSSPANTPLKKSSICIPIGNRVLSMDYNFQTNVGGTGGTKTFNKTKQSLTSTNFQSGSQYLFTMTGLGAWVPTEPSAKIGGYTWSAYNVANTSKQFVSKPTDYGYYFTFNDAKSACPSGWSTPTKTQLDVLPGKVIPANSYVYINNAVYKAGNYGWCGPSTSNGYAIFKDGVQILCMPAAGRRSGSGSTAEGSNGYYGYYWSSTPNGSNGGDLYFFSGGCSVGNFYSTIGMSVRCVQ